MPGPQGQERVRSLVEALYAAAWNLDPNPTARAYDARLITSAAGYDASATVVGLVEHSDGEAPGVAFLAEPSVYSLACADEDELLALWASIAVQVDSPLPDGTISGEALDTVGRALNAMKEAEEELDEVFDPKYLADPARRSLAKARPAVQVAHEALRTRFSAPIP
jgi:hypothetical protein